MVCVCVLGGVGVLVKLALFFLPPGRLQKGSKMDITRKQEILNEVHMSFGSAPELLSLWFRSLNTALNARVMIHHSVTPYMIM